MSAPTLDVFSLRESIVNEYKHFATSFTTIHANDIREQVEAICAQNRYWPEPLIQINPSYKRSTDISKLVDHHILDPRCAEIFQSKGTSLSLYKASGTGYRTGDLGRELRRYDGNRVWKVTLLLRPDREPCA
jgi:hypothetical protein